MSIHQHQDFMRKALVLAEKAAELDEVPVGALIVREAEVIGEGWNCPISTHDPSAHAEMMAIRAAAKRVGNYRLPGATLYVTIEPCSMCVGAMVHARIETLVFGASEPKAGAVQSAVPLFNHEAHNHKMELVAGVLTQDCADLIQAFFRQKRSNSA